jgi:hypothetical protein
VKVSRLVENEPLVFAFHQIMDFVVPPPPAPVNAVRQGDRMRVKKIAQNVAQLVFCQH